MKYILFFLLLFPSLSYSQKVAINFVNDSNWTQLTNRAKVEKKSILVDCYTTWCVWCRWLDSKIFTSPKVGAFINDKFIAVKIQFDSSSHDNSFIKSWYADAHRLMEQYNIHSFPTVLYFDSEGNALTKQVGVDSKGGADGFVEKVKNALDESQQFFSLRRRYEEGNIDATLLKQLTKASFFAGENEYEKFIFKKFLSETHGIKLDIGRITFLCEMARDIKDTAFKILMNQYKNFDALTKNPISSDKIREILYYSVADKFIFRGRGQVENYRYYLKEPDWSSLYSQLKIINSVFAKETLLLAKIEFYKYEGNWKECIKNIVLLTENNPHVNAETLANNATIVYQHANECDIPLLNTALQWIRQSLKWVKTEPSFLLQERLKVAIAKQTI